VNLPVHFPVAAPAAARQDAHMLTEMSERFYVSFPLAPGYVQLEGSEAHHLATVSRMRPGDEVILFNGDGRQYHSIIQSIAKKHVTLTVESVSAPIRELPFRLEIVVPLPKGDRGQFLIEKLTEIGVAVYSPLQTQRSVMHPSDAKMDKLQRYVIEASKQCGRNTLMTIGPLAKWAVYATQQPGPSKRWLAHPGGRPSMELHAAHAHNDVVIAIGPEGGWTDDEVGLAQKNGWGIVDLGPRILRVETAAIALAHLAGLGE
jgi:16S rRNA (uracil1498-N3)-methyltransferase